jgi:hypothetical protein
MAACRAEPPDFAYPTADAEPEDFGMGLVVSSVVLIRDSLQFEGMKKLTDFCETKRKVDR